MNKIYNLTINRVPLATDIQYQKPYFEPMDDLYLDLLENRLKLKKNPPKPIFVRKPESKPASQPKQKPREAEPDSGSGHYSDDDDDDLMLEDLEDRYKSEMNGESDHETSSDHDDTRPSAESEPEPSKPQQQQPPEYTEAQFKQEQQAEESEEARYQREIDDMLRKFVILKKKYPSAVIPEYTQHSDINVMKRTYNNILRDVTLDSNVDYFKKGLYFGWLIIELVAVNLFHIDLLGFTKAQTNYMSEYDALLVELGEKHSSLASAFPVEVRLLLLIIFQAVVFGVSKIVFGGAVNVSGTGLFNMLGSMLGMGGAQQASNQPRPPAGGYMPQSRGHNQPQQQSGLRNRNRMRGPTISPDDIDNE